MRHVSSRSRPECNNERERQDQYDIIDGENRANDYEEEDVRLSDIANTFDHVDEARWGHRRNSQSGSNSQHQMSQSSDATQWNDRGESQSGSNSQHYTSQSSEAPKRSGIIEEPVDESESRGTHFSRSRIRRCQRRRIYCSV